ncbi:chorion class B protein PC10-like [Spodoptera frugiperda]|uniref:Chorion class B protein PC10-like n=1 Tax=Spodoptera frugiperda TaxID=7108 RepID=A0A9R0CZ47_SPOFR|nr:chorion class B protein PC10-like [Spodoptera frugiperda]
MGAMSLKVIFFVCIQTIFFESVFSACVPPAYLREPVCGNMPIVEGWNMASVAPVAPIYGRVIGGNLIIDTSAPYAAIGPAGVSIFSDNLLIDGVVLVTGRLPFQGTVGLEGVVPTSGIGAVNYSSGASNIGFVESAPNQVPGVIPNGVGLPGGYPGMLGFGRLEASY